MEYVSKQSADFKILKSAVLAVTVVFENANSYHDGHWPSVNTQLTATWVPHPCLSA